MTKESRKNRSPNNCGFIFVFASVVTISGSEMVKLDVESRKEGAVSDAILLRFEKRGKLPGSKGLVLKKAAGRDYTTMRSVSVCGRT